MRKKYLTFVLIPILSSCGFFGYGNRSGDMLPKGPKPLTIKEKNFIEQLKSRGYFNIEIDSPFIGEGPYGHLSYSISMESNLVATYDKMDSIRNIQFEIAKDIYNVLEDSMKEEISIIYVDWKMKAKNMYYPKINSSKGFEKYKLIDSITE